MLLAISNDTTINTDELVSYKVYKYCDNYYIVFNFKSYAPQDKTETLKYDNFYYSNKTGNSIKLKFSDSTKEEDILVYKKKIDKVLGVKNLDG